MREPCIDCVIKHLMRAMSQMDEELLGHPESYFLAIGEMAEAEGHCLSVDIALAQRIRELRKEYQSHTPVNLIPVAMLINALERDDE